MQKKLAKNFYTTLLLIVFILASSCSTYEWTSKNVERYPAQANIVVDAPHAPLRIARADLQKILKLSTEFLVHPMARDVVKLGLGPKDNGIDGLSSTFAISDKVKKSLLETQCIELLATNKDFYNFVVKFLNDGKNIANDKSSASESFKVLQSDELRKVNFGTSFEEFSGFRPLPIILTDSPAGYQNVKMFASHDRFSESGEVIKAQNLVNEVKAFIAGAQSDITINVFEFDLEEIAVELDKAKARGVKVTVGIDANIIKEKPGVKKVYDYLVSRGINVHPVSSVGLNHQKIIVRDVGIPGKSKVLISSSNFTKSDMHPNGDLGDLPLRHPNSIPNANHLMTIDSDAIALIAHNELQKTIVYKLKGDRYPLSGSFQVMGLGGTEKKPPYLVMAFTPKGAMGNVNTNLISHAIRRNCSDKIFMAQFAFSSPSAMAAILNCVKTRKEAGLKTRLITVGDTPFAMQNWSMFLSMSGLEQKVDPLTRLKFYLEDETSKFREIFDSEEDFREFIKDIKIGPDPYSTKHVELNGNKYELVAKIHHKSLSSGDMAIIGTSFNFSEAAETNQEQFFVFVDKKLAKEYQGIVTHLHQQSSRSVWEEAQRRNQVRRQSFGEIKKIILELSKNISNAEPLERSNKLLRRLVAMTSEEEAVGILNRALSQFKNDGHGALNFSFDWDDNIFFTKTKVLIYEKETNKVLEVSTEEWVHAKNLVGVQGTEYENYEVRADSYQHFRDKDANGSNFINDVLSAIDDDKEGKMRWKGPAWDDFVLACSTEKTAQQTSIITARGHDPKTIHRAMTALQQRGLIKHVPPVSGVWAVTNANFSQSFQNVFGKSVAAGSVQSPSAAKAEVMKEILDRISKKRLKDEIGMDKDFKFVSPDGKNYSAGHLWGFSDDDYDNFKKAKDVLQPEIDKGRWPNVKVTLMYTGKGHPDLKDRLIVLRKNAAPRAASPLEFLEWRQAMAKTKNTEGGSCAELVEKFFKAF